MKKITATVGKGTHRGTILRPHRYQEGYYLVSRGGNTLDCAKQIFSEAELESWVQRGYGIRMSGPGVAPSIYSPRSLTIL